MRFLTLLSFPALISCLAFYGPKPTPSLQNVDIGAHGWSPKPTAGPSMGELRKRAAQETIIAGPDNTCGYISGSSAEPFGLCSAYQTCAFGTISGGGGDLYCGDTSTGYTSRIYSTCIDVPSSISSCLADPSCSADPGVRLCSNDASSTYLYCATAVFEPIEVSALYCTYATGDGLQIISTTYRGGPARAFTTVSDNVITTTISSSSFSSTTSSTTSTRPVSSSTGGMTSSSSTSTSPVPPPTPAPSSSTPVGAIAGGVVGGVAVIVAAVVGIFLCLRHKKRKNTTAAAPTSANPISQQPPHQPPPQGYHGAPATYQQPGPQMYNTNNGDGAQVFPEKTSAMAQTSPVPTYSSYPAQSPPPNMASSPPPQFTQYSPMSQQQQLQHQQNSYGSYAPMTPASTGAISEMHSNSTSPAPGYVQPSRQMNAGGQAQGQHHVNLHEVMS